MVLSWIAAREVGVIVSQPAVSAGAIVLQWTAVPAEVESNVLRSALTDAGGESINGSGSGTRIDCILMDSSRNDYVATPGGASISRRCTIVIHSEIGILFAHDAVVRAWRGHGMGEIHEIERILNDLSLLLTKNERKIPYRQWR